MSYLNVVSLDDAKIYLRIDDTLNDDDGQITSMIQASCKIVERITNVLLYAREKSYLFQNYCVNVYDFPINSVTSPSNLTTNNYELFTTYETNNSSDTNLVLNVGYTDANDVPEDLVQIILNMVKHFYYDADTNKFTYGNLPVYIQQALAMNKRFII